MQLVKDLGYVYKNICLQCEQMSFSFAAWYANDGFTEDKDSKIYLDAKKCTSVNPLDCLNDGNDNRLVNMFMIGFSEDVNNCFDGHGGFEDHGNGGPGTPSGACDIILSPISIPTHVSDHVAYLIWNDDENEDVNANDDVRECFTFVAKPMVGF